MMVVDTGTDGKNAVRLTPCFYCDGEILKREVYSRRLLDIKEQLLKKMQKTIPDGMFKIVAFC